jgi:hypothetical protein
VAAFKPENLRHESGEEYPLQNRTESRETPLPLISDAECRFIEESGGEYRGFVDRARGHRHFEDVVVNQVAYYDQSLRTVVQIFVSTEAVNDANTNELEGPSSVRGFSTLIVCRSRSGESLEQPQITRIQSENFPDAPRDAQDLRFIAHQLHRFVVQNIGHAAPRDLKTNAEAYLSQIGWASKTG